MYKIIAIVLLIGVTITEIRGSSADAHQGLLELYIDYLDSYPKRLYSDLPGSQFDEQSIKNYTGHYFVLEATEARDALEKVIYNIQSYEDVIGNSEPQGMSSFRINNPKLIEIGNPLILKNFDYTEDKINSIKNVPREFTQYLEKVHHKQDIPIGYTLYLPKGDIKGILIEVYGGGTATKGVLALENLDNYLIKQGIAIVKLNLIDLLELKDLQLEMPEALHKKLHASIDKMFQTLRNNPEELSSDPATQELLKTLKDKRIVLFGASFGGRTAVRHAELYPGTMDGYISHDGALSLKMQGQSDLFSNDRATVLAALRARAWLNPLGDNKIRAIQDPILLLHNLNDHNVNVKVILDFYQEAVKLNKENFIHLFMTQRGNSAGKEVIEKGHYVTEQPQAFQSYAKTIASFVVGDLSNSPTRNQWMAHQYEIYANKNYTSATFEERFISVAYRLYKAPYYRAKPNDARRTARTHAEMMAEMDDTRNNQPTEGLIKQIRQKQQDRDNLKFEQFWQEGGQPLYNMMKYLDMAKRNRNILLEETTDNLNNISDENIEKAIDVQIPSFLDYMSEQRTPSPLEISKIKSLLQEIFKVLFPLVQENDPSTQQYFIECLYMGNPALMKKRFSKLMDSDKEELSEMKQSLKTRILQDKAFVIKLSDEMRNQRPDSN